jgi:repressor LexA
MKKERPGRRPATEITEPQRKTLKEICDYIATYEYPPTIKELAEILGIACASAHAQVNHLVRKGYLRRVSGSARGLAVIRKPGDGIADLIPVPIIGTVAAGQPIFAEENIIGEILVEGRIVRTGRCYALEISGDSMIDAGIQEGDLVIVRQQPMAENGDIVVALLGDEATVKRLYIREAQVELRPENAMYQPIPITPDDDFRILGKVVAIRHTSER